MAAEHGPGVNENVPIGIIDRKGSEALAGTPARSDPPYRVLHGQELIALPAQVQNHPLEKLRGDFEPSVGCKSFLRSAAWPHVVQHEQRSDAARQGRQKAGGSTVKQEIK